MISCLTLTPKITRNACNFLCIEYKATLPELLLSGALTPDLFAPLPRGKTRLDVDGDRCMIQRFRSGLIEVRYSKPDWRAKALPGVADWLAREVVPSDEVFPQSVHDCVAYILERFAR